MPQPWNTSCFVICRRAVPVFCARQEASSTLPGSPGGYLLDLPYALAEALVLVIAGCLRETCLQHLYRHMLGICLAYA